MMENTPSVLARFRSQTCVCSLYELEKHWYIGTAFQVTCPNLMSPIRFTQIQGLRQFTSGKPSENRMDRRTTRICKSGQSSSTLDRASRTNPPKPLPCKGFVVSRVRYDISLEYVRLRQIPSELHLWIEIPLLTGLTIDVQSAPLKSTSACWHALWTGQCVLRR